MSHNGSITITVDGQLITTTPGKTVLEAALDAGAYIPHLCHDPLLEPYGGCRLCIVKIDGMRGLPTACTTQAADGMVVHSEVDEVFQVRRMTAELLISDHPADCLTCGANQDCELQKLANYFGIDATRVARNVRAKKVDDNNPFYVRDTSKCVLCGKCARVCHEVRGVSNLDFAGRGHKADIAAFGGGPLIDSRCVSCGACVDICPVGSLLPKLEALPPTREVSTICPYCGCGCGLILGIRGDRIVRVRGDKNNPGSRGQMCVKGRFGLQFVSAPDRLTTPLIRRDGELQEATWDEALDLVAARLTAIGAESGAGAIAGFSSAKCTNEENYVFEKFFRAVVGTNHVDHCARLCHSSTVAGLAASFGSGAMTNSMGELERSDCILVTGSNTSEAHPIIALRIRAAVTQHGASLIVADPRRIDLVRHAAMHLRQRSGSDVLLFNAFMHVIIEEELYDKAFVEERTEGFDELCETVAPCTPELAELTSGVPADDIRKAARVFAAAERASIIYSMGITQHTTGTDNVKALANLAMLTGNVGFESTGVNPLRGQNNVQGACDLGALPNVFPGYQKVADPAVRAKFAEAWGRPVPEEPGLTVVEILRAAETGDVRALYVMGENPVLSDPNANRTRKAIEALDFLVVQDIFLTETAEYADVVLPAASFAEKDGTFTNTERRVQRVRKALDPPGEARVDWEILCDLAGRMGVPMSYPDAGAIMDEIAALTPIYGGMAYDRLEGVGLQWPCADREHPGTPYLHKGAFTRGLGKFHATPFREAAELPDQEYPFLLSTGRVLYHFHTATMTRRSDGLNVLYPGGDIQVNPDDAERLGIEHDGWVAVASRRGEVKAKALVTDRVPPGMVYMPFHFREASANVLTNDALDPVAKIPEFKVCAVRLERVD